MANDQASVKEWGQRAGSGFVGLIIDYLSGMTDDFALRTYQVISGASA